MRPLLAKLLNEPTPEGINAAELILRGLIGEAAKGNTRAAELILKRAYGEPPRVLELQTEFPPLSWLNEV